MEKFSSLQSKDIDQRSLQEFIHKRTLQGKVINRRFVLILFFGKLILHLNEENVSQNQFFNYKRTLQSKENLF